MSELKFSRNYSDHSIQNGVNAGFQFEFRCERCSDAWRSEFSPYRGAQASDWLGKAAGLFGGILRDVSVASDGLAHAGYGKAHDVAFQAAIAQATVHFHRCAKCLSYVCEPCWSIAKGLCRSCAPDASVEVNAARATGEIEAAKERATEAGRQSGAAVDVSADSQLVCPKCKSETHGAKFCPECGEKLMVTLTCKQCSKAIPSGSKFCPECGAHCLEST